MELDPNLMIKGEVSLIDTNLQLALALFAHYIFDLVQTSTFWPFQ
jgi:hypothetical protein